MSTSSPFDCFIKLSRLDFHVSGDFAKSISQAK